jgi:hypothetical protein
MHELAEQLVALTQGVGWEATRYMTIGRVMEKLTTYCATCDCQRGRRGTREMAMKS